MSFEAIRKSSAPQMVIEQILAKLDAGELAAGDRLPSQNQLATLLGVGRSSVREAINALAVMGYLDIYQGRGTFIRQPLPRTPLSSPRLQSAIAAGSIIDLMEVRELIECRSARLAAERADATHLQQLAAAVEKVRASGDDYDRFLAADFQFHRRLAEAGQNRVICEMMPPIIDRLQVHYTQFRRSVLMPTIRERALASIERILACIRSGDAEPAAAEMAEHLRTTIDELEEIVTRE